MKQDKLNNHSSRPPLRLNKGKGNQAKKTGSCINPLLVFWLIARTTENMRTQFKKQSNMA